MQEFKQKQRHKRVQQIAFSIPIFVILGIIMVLMTIAVWNIHIKARGTQANLDKITNVYEELHARELELAASVKDLKTSFGVESEIRDRYGLARVGEEVVVIIDEEDEEKVNNKKERKSWWQKFKDLF